MTPFRWTLLCLFFTLYLLFGGSIFMLIEQHHEIHQKEELHVLRQDIQEILFRLDKNFYNESTSADVLEALKSAKEGVINRIASVCSIDNLLEGPEQQTTLKWTYYNSVFFAFTVITTIGYGHLSPSTSLSKSLMIVYALFGIPLNGILLSGVGDYFSNKIVRVHQKSKEKQYRGKHVTLIFEIIFYLIPGIVVFIIIPAGIFVLIENWTFLDSIYYCFVSLTTIGFGDYVAGMGDGHNVWLWLYKVFIIVWITFGLGYLIMILGFIAKGMKSKKVRGVLEKRLTGIRNTKDKLSKDIDYMRKIVNELYLMKTNKPVYDVSEIHDGDSIAHDKIGGAFGIRSRRPSCVHFERRCNSLPRRRTYELEENSVPSVPDPQDVNVNMTYPSFHTRLRRLSEGDATQVDRDNTFLRRDSVVSREELLVSVVNALSENMMQNVMDAVDELNKYEKEVEDEKNCDGGESLEESSDEQDKDCKHYDVESGSKRASKTKEGPGVLPPRDLGAVSEFDEEAVLDEDKKTDQLERVVIPGNSTSKEKETRPSVLEKVGGVIRKISGTKSPPETPSRKISRNDSDKSRKISQSESSPGMRRSNGYSSFSRRSSTRHQTSLVESDPRSSHHYSKYRKPSLDVRKISQESHVSNTSNSSYQTIDEMLTSARMNKSRKSTPAHYHPQSPLLRANSSCDQVDDGNSVHGKLSVTSTTSLAQLLRALDTVQDRLKKPSVCSDASFSGSYLSSDHSDAVDLSNSFAPSVTAKPIRRPFRRSTSAQEGVDRRRKVGIFQPGFSYVNLGFNPDDEEEPISVIHERKTTGIKNIKENSDEFDNTANSASISSVVNNNNNNNDDDKTTIKR